MPMPTILSGRFHAGADFVCGENVTVDVEEEVILGDRCTLAAGTYLGGRRVVISDDFYGYGSDSRLDVGRGRRDDEDAILSVGSRCTFHNCRVDLARRVTIGDDVGLSPDVVIYNHGYWLSCLEGFPCRHAPVEIGDGVIVGFRSVVLPGAAIGARAVIGAQSVVTGEVLSGYVCAGNPARCLYPVAPLSEARQRAEMVRLLNEYRQTCEYRGIASALLMLDWPCVLARDCTLDVLAQTVEGEEDEYTDDIREFLFKRGIRLYSKRPFRKMGRRK